MLSLALALAWGAPGAWAQSQPPEVAAELPGARLQGGGRLRVFGFQVYDARLWTTAPNLPNPPNPPNATNAQNAPEGWATLPLALELQYLRSLDGAQIAERSLKEMRRQGDIAPVTAERWLAEMTKLFPDVAAGDRITAVYQPDQGVRFFVNAKLKGEVKDAEFARWFMGIWLSPRTSEPAMRDALLGGSDNAKR